MSISSCRTRLKAVFSTCETPGRDFLSGRAEVHDLPGEMFVDGSALVRSNGAITVSMSCPCALLTPDFCMQASLGEHCHTTSTRGTRTPRRGPPNGPARDKSAHTREIHGGAGCRPERRQPETEEPHTRGLARTPARRVPERRSDRVRVRSRGGSTEAPKDLAKTEHLKRAGTLFDSTLFREQTEQQVGEVVGGWESDAVATCVRIQSAGSA